MSAAGQRFCPELWIQPQIEICPCSLVGVNAGVRRQWQNKPPAIPIEWLFDLLRILRSGSFFVLLFLLYHRVVSF